MRVLALIAGFVLLAVVLLDAFQSIILPRRPVGRFRITRIFFMSTWNPWKLLARGIRSHRQRDQFYSTFGPLSLLLLFFVWGALLTLGFGLVFFGLRMPFRDPLLASSGHWPRLRSCLYFSGTTLFTLGMGDVAPLSQVARLLTVIEAGTGLGFIALVIGYVPVLYTAFSQREVLVALLDARAGSPPTAAELLLRHNFPGGTKILGALLAEWEHWCAQMLETHISYPILCYYRSQHDNQSWLSALTAVLDTCALLITMLEGGETRQAQLTFAIGRHTLVDLVHVFNREVEERRLRENPATRLDSQQLDRLCEALEHTGFSPCSDFESRDRLAALRNLYEPSAQALADYLRLELPAWAPPPANLRKTDAWTVVEGLRTSEALADRLTHHVSTRSTAINLETHDREPE